MRFSAHWADYPDQERGNRSGRQLREYDGKPDDRKPISLAAARPALIFRALAGARRVCAQASYVRWRKRHADNPVPVLGEGGMGITSKSLVNDGFRHFSKVGHGEKFQILRQDGRTISRLLACGMVPKLHMLGPTERDRTELSRLQRKMGVPARHGAVLLDGLPKCIRPLSGRAARRSSNGASADASADLRA